MSEESETEALSYDIKITNSAAKRMKKVMIALDEDSAKNVVSLGLEVLDYTLSNDAELVAQKKDGESIKLILRKSDE